MAEEKVLSPGARAVMDMMTLRQRHAGVTDAVLAEVVRSERIMAALIAGANEGPEGFARAAKEAYRELQVPTKGEIEDLAERVAPSTRAGATSVAEVLRRRAEGQAYSSCVRGASASGWYGGRISDDTARRWVDIAAQEEPRFQSVLLGRALKGLPVSADRRDPALEARLHLRAVDSL
ncbi:hypothetical protein [Gordonia sp. 852002-10350_SCH5691597]|uniref:hypothetical protein n=1 Tax=Gordonia sp. 852002-10350_SCH5691597 TaxID=1834085 RepID=UPI0012E74B32|nr:hypothetical protein [Gordonia sp. 852002-10350_SCH5691597]